MNSTETSIANSFFNKLKNTVWSPLNSINLVKTLNILMLFHQQGNQFLWRQRLSLNKLRTQNVNLTCLNAFQNTRYKIYQRDFI